MENKEPNSVLKTPRRTRRTSVQESQKSPLGRLETVDSDGSSLSLSRKDPITPGRSTRTLDNRTPSRPDGLTAIQTPRRSCRKSIKPIQEYENIVAQKGLCVKRLITDPTLSEEVEEEASSTIEVRENKWTPADIGRVSTKRSKKKRNKNKRLVRQKNITVQEEEKVPIDQSAKSDVEMDSNELENKNEENINFEEVITKAENNKDVETLPTELATADIQIKKTNAVESDDSMDEGDVILNAMPITGDDCINSPEKQLNPDLKTFLSVTPVVESANKSDDSDCIMLSLNDSSQSRQSLNQKPSSPVGDSKIAANESSDSTGINMPPLLLCSDDEDEDDVELVDDFKSLDGANLELPINKEDCVSNDPGSLNGTFAAKENVEEQSNDIIMYPEEKNAIEITMCPDEIRKIVIGIEEKPKEVITSAPEDAQIIDLNGTYDADDSRTKTLDTLKSPIAQPSISRTLTPFKTHKPILPDIIIEPEEEFQEPPKFVYELIENKLKSSRKRSSSFSIDRPKKNVTFHSPANKTMSIYPGELVKSATKNTPANITKRRKRSLSVTETDRDLMDYIKMTKPTHDATPKKKPVQQSRIKMPNFSNIHQKQFQRMESITDHVARRAERAKILINSSSKVKPASVQKSLHVKNSVLRDHNKDGNKTHLPMPKARQKIDMSEVENKPKAEITSSLNTGTKSRSKSKQDLRMLEDLPLVGKTPTKVIAANTTSLFRQNNSNKLPKQKFNFNFNSTTTTTTTTTTVPTCGNTTVAALPQRLHLPNPRENFNLSTTITTTKHQAPKVEKLEDRRKRMMEMFKSKSSQRVTEKQKEILKGVRTNRRFELQMMCRNRQN